MNPASVEQKKGIIDILNKADLDSSTGMSNHRTIAQH